MTPVDPEVPDGSRLVVFAKDQPEYNRLPAAVDDHGRVVTEWVPTEDELACLMVGGRIRLSLAHAIGERACEACGAMHRRLLSPVCLEVIEPECGMRES